MNKYGIHPIQAILNVQLTKEEEFIFRERLQGKIVSLALVIFLIRTSTARL
jgi:ERCC4-type nuclease